MLSSIDLAVNSIQYTRAICEYMYNSFFYEPAFSSKP